MHMLQHKIAIKALFLARKEAAGNVLDSREFAGMIAIHDRDGSSVVGSDNWRRRLEVAQFLKQEALVQATPVIGIDCYDLRFR